MKQHNEEIAIEWIQKVEFAWDDVWRLFNDFFDVNGYVLMHVSGVRLERRLFLLLDIRTVLIHLSPLKDLSAVHEVTGRVQKIVTRVLMLG